LCTDEKAVYGIAYFLKASGQSPVFYPGDGYLLFSGQTRAGRGAKPAEKEEKGRSDAKAAGSYGTGFKRFAVTIPIRVRAMVKTSDKLFIAGPPDIVDKADPLAALEGRKGAVLRAYLTATGEQVFETELDSPPVFDGMIAAAGALYIALTDGSIVCLK
jgi:hypothetical protein